MELITIGDDRYMVLEKVSVDSGYSIEELKSMWGLADTVIRNGDTLYICSKLIVAEFYDV